MTICILPWPGESCPVHDGHVVLIPTVSIRMTRPQVQRSRQWHLNILLDYILDKMDLLSKIGHVWLLCPMLRQTIQTEPIIGFIGKVEHLDIIPSSYIVDGTSSQHDDFASILQVDNLTCLVINSTMQQVLGCWWPTFGSCVKDEHFVSCPCAISSTHNPQASVNCNCTVSMDPISIGEVAIRSQCCPGVSVQIVLLCSTIAKSSGLSRRS